MNNYKHIKNSIISLIFLSTLITGQIANDLIPQNEPFFIQSAINHNKNNGGFWDIPGGEENIRERAKIVTWALTDQAKDRKYVVVPSSKNGFVNIQIEGIAANIDVKGGENKNGTDIQVFQPNNLPNQNFRFLYVGNGKFKIFNENGKLITLAGRSSDNGSQVQMWDDHNGEWTEWLLISARSNQVLNLDNQFKPYGQDMTGISTFYIQSALYYGKDTKGFWDCPGTAYPKSGDNLQIYELSDFNYDRKFQIMHSATSFNHYSISVADNPNIVVGIDKNNPGDGVNVLLWDRVLSTAQNFTFKHMGNGRFKIFNYHNRVVCTGREGTNGMNIHTWGDHEGPWMEWYFIDAETHLPFIPGESGLTGVQDIRVPNVSCENEKQLISSIDLTYEKVSEIEAKTIQVNQGVSSANYTVGNAYGLTYNFGKLNSDVNDTYSALSAFCNIPVIGNTITALSTGLNIAKSELNRANSALTTLQGPVIGQANSNVLVSKRTMVGLTSNLHTAKSLLTALKGKLAQAQNKSGADALFAKLNSCIAGLNGNLANMDTHLDKIGQTCRTFEKIKDPVIRVDNGVKAFEKAFRQVDRVADEINNVLEKRFKKEIAKVKIDITLRDVLEGGKVGKAFKKYASEWAEDMLKPLIKKMGVKIPTVPGVDDFKQKIHESADVTKQLRDNSQNLEKLIQEINNSNSEINNSISTII